MYMTLLRWWAGAGCGWGERWGVKFFHSKLVWGGIRKVIEKKCYDEAHTR